MSPVRWTPIASAILFLIFLAACLSVAWTDRAAADVCGKECRQAKDYCKNWESQHPGRECGRVRGAVCIGKNWKKITQVNTLWSACELVGGSGDYNNALARCDEYEENWGGNCQVHSPLCNAGWVQLGKYGSFRACRERSASGSIKYDLYQLFMRRWEGKASISIPQHLRPFIEKQYGIDASSMRWGKVGDQPHSTCITDCDKIYCDRQSFIDAISSGYGWDENVGNTLAFHELAHVMQCREKGGRKEYADFWFENLRKGLGIGIKNFGLLSEEKRKEMVQKVHDDMPMEKSAEEKARTVLAAYVEGWWHKAARCRVFAPDRRTIVHESSNSYPRYACDPEFNQDVFKRLVGDAKKKVAAQDLGMGRYHIAIGRPDEGNGAWIGTYDIAFKVVEASAGLSATGEVCPKPAKIVMLAATDGPRKLRMRRKLAGAWSDWSIIEAKTVGTGYLASYEERHDNYLGPGQHRVDFEIDGFDKAISATVDVTCPPLRIVSAELKFDPGDGYLCPRKVTTTETIVTNGPGSFRKRQEREGGEPGEWSRVEAGREGNQYVYRGVNVQEAGAVNQKRRVVAQPGVAGLGRVESNWAYVIVDCLKIEEASITYLGPAEATCPFKTRARLNIGASLPVGVPYRLDCNNDQSLSGSFPVATGTSSPFSSTKTVDIDAAATGTLACALKIDQGKGMLPVTFQGYQIKCQDVLDAAIYIDGPDQARCPADLPVRVRVNARDETAVPYDLRCTTGDNWNGSIAVARTAPNTYIGVVSKQVRVSQSGKIACALRSSLTGASKVVALRAKDFTCAAPAVPTPPSVGLPPGGAKPPSVGLVCDNGSVRGARCVCPPGTTLKRVAARHFSCDRVIPLGCVGGKAVNNRCVCPRGAQTLPIGPNAFRCACPPGTRVVRSACVKAAN